MHIIMKNLMCENDILELGICIFSKFITTISYVLKNLWKMC